MPQVRSALTTILLVLVATAIAAVSFIYRFNTLDGRLAGFENDHFPQLVRSMAMLDGERPLRDFTDAELRALWPAPAYSTSALAQKLFGRSLRSEALLTIGLLSIGAAALFLVSAQFAGSIVPALIMTLLAVSLRPALYNYPKIVLYVLAIAAMTAYARRSTAMRLVVLGVVVAIAALFRHDHGVYLALAATTLLVMRHGREFARPFAILATTCGVVMLPGVVLAHIDGGFLKYLHECIELSRAEAARTTNPSVKFSIDLSQPLLQQVERDPIKMRFAVRWAPTMTAEARYEAERELQLSDPVMRNDESNWSYTTPDTSPTHLSAIVRDARVIDTDGIDRSRFTLTSTPPPPEGVVSKLLRWRIAPGMFRADNAAPWLYLVAWGVVLCATGWAFWPRARWASAPSPVPAAAVRATCVLAVLMLALLLRTPNASRFADVSVAVTILGAWLMADVPRALRAGARWKSAAVIAGFTIVLMVSTAAIAVLADVPHQIGIAGLNDLERAQRQWRDVSERLAALPSSLDGIDEDLQRASAYLRRCTQPSDRIFMGENLPEVFYFADRPFAAGQMRYFSNFYSSSGQQREAIDRWSRQMVPIAITQPGARFDAEFAVEYPLLADYLRTHYRKAGSMVIERGATVDIWVDSARSFTTDGASGLPCEVSRD